ncbi:MAG: hypothetical protein ACFHVJ_01020 [Aestuariibacter sp.]
MNAVLIRLKLVLLAFTLGFAQCTFALPEQCIEDPLRRNPCPHVIYKTVNLPNKDTGEDERQMVCICLTDFKDLFTKADSEVKQKIKEMNLRSLSAQLGISEEKLREIVQYN